MPGTQVQCLVMVIGRVSSIRVVHHHSVRYLLDEVIMTIPNPNLLYPDIDEKLCQIFDSPCCDGTVQFMKYQRSVEISHYKSVHFHVI